MSKIVYILRGISGAGKSTLAAELNMLAYWNKQIAAYCSADPFFINNGEYFFEQSKLGAAHEYCRTSFQVAINDNIDLIIVDNTNTQHREYKFYKEEAVKAGYQVQVIIVGEFTDEAVELYAQRNAHGVPIETIRKMRDRFQL